MSKLQIRAVRALATAAVVAVAGAVPVAAQARPAPTVRQLVVFKSGRAVESTVAARGLTAPVGRRRCAIATATPLAALLRSRVARLGLRDFGSCSARRTADSGQIYVGSIGSERARGRSGWVYKVGNRSASSGAADPTGPFGNGPLRPGQRVVWFYGTQSGDSFQRTLAVSVGTGAPGMAVVRVRSYDDEGRGRSEAGATVTSGSVTAATGADGSATLVVGAGSRRFVASEKGLIRSFTERSTIR